MTQTSPFLTHIRELHDEHPVLARQDPSVEVSENTWRIGRAPDDPASLTEIADAMHALSEAWHAAVAPDAATVYVWYDAMSGHLQVSLTSRRPDDLPFGGRIRVVKEADIVAAHVLGDGNAGILAWSEFTEVPMSEAFGPDGQSLEEPDEREPVPVWADWQDGS